MAGCRDLCLWNPSPPAYSVGTARSGGRGSAPSDPPCWPWSASLGVSQSRSGSRSRLKGETRAGIRTAVAVQVIILVISLKKGCFGCVNEPASELQMCSHVVFWVPSLSFCAWLSFSLLPTYFNTPSVTLLPSLPLHSSFKSRKSYHISTGMWSSLHKIHGINHTWNPLN